jgi:urease accessory protein
MRRATGVAGKGHWPGAEAAGTVVLDYDARHRRRIRLACEDGSPILLDLEKATALRDGDGLALDGGGWIAVRAAAEDLVEITCAGAHDLHRIAWHLGNRHCPAAIEKERILIRRDHVIEEMLRGIGATVNPVQAPFDPERGAYDEHNLAQGHSHD